MMLFWLMWRVESQNLLILIRLKMLKFLIDTDDDVLGGFDLKEFVLLNFCIIKEDATYFLQIFPEEGIYRNE